MKPGVAANDAVALNPPLGLAPKFCACGVCGLKDALNPVAGAALKLDGAGAAKFPVAPLAPKAGGKDAEGAGVKAAG